MFEKESEEYANKYVTEGVDELKIKVIKGHWQDGAEFGYNKANEWNYVSEKGLPKESGRYFVYFGGGENGVYPLDFDTEANDFGYWCLQVGENLGVTDTIFETITERNEDKVIAWKEIVLPELKEIEE